jgi:N-acetylmuramoyl-L-alanine amidase
MLYISRSDFNHNIVPLLAPNQIPNPPALQRIVIDPGHGGKDPGAQNAALKLDEKAATLETAKLLAAELKSRHYDVSLTRTTDTFVELPERSAIANRANADLFISIHYNVVDDPSVTGIETFILTPPGQPSTKNTDLSESDKVTLPGNRFDYWNSIVGFSVQKAVATELKATNRGVKRAHLIVLKGLQMPGLLVEGGFVTSPTEGAKIRTTDYRTQVAKAIADGIDLYKKTLDNVKAVQKSVPVTAPSPKQK